MEAGLQGMTMPNEARPANPAMTSCFMPDASRAGSLTHDVGREP